MFSHRQAEVGVGLDYSSIVAHNEKCIGMYKFLRACCLYFQYQNAESYYR